MKNLQMNTLPIGKFVRFFELAAGSGCGHFLFKIKSYIAQLFFDIANDFTLGYKDTKFISWDIRGRVGLKCYR